MRRLPIRCCLAVFLVACAADQPTSAPTGPLALVPIPPPPPEYRLNVLTSPDTVDSWVSAINNAGTMVGGMRFITRADRATIAVRWDAAGAWTPLSSGMNVDAVDIGDSGEIVANRTGAVWVYTDPTSRYTLSLPTGAVGATGSAIDWRGTIVGTYTERKGLQRAIRWTRTGPKTWLPVALPMPPGGTTSGARDINAVGDISGWYTDRNGKPHACVWFAHGPVVSVSPIASTDGLRLNNKQFMLLYRENGAGVVVPTIVHAPTGASEPDLKIPTGTGITALNDVGRVVGVAPFSVTFGSSLPQAPITLLPGSARAVADLPFSFSANVVPRGTASDVNLCGTAVGSLKRPSSGVMRAMQWLRVDGCDVDDAPVLRVGR